MKKKIVWTVMTTCLIGLISGCGTADTATTDQMEEKTSEMSTGKADEDTLTIRVGTTGAMAGWDQLGDNGELEGLEIDIWNEIAARNDWKVEFTTADFTALWGMLDNDQIDTIADGTTVNDERLQKYWFSDTYLWDSYVVVMQGDDDVPEDGDMAWWNGKTICCEAGQNPQLVLDQMNEELGNKINVRYLDSSSVLVPDILNGSSDGAFMIKTNAKINIDELGYDDLVMFDPQYKNTPMTYAWTKKAENKDILKKVNATLAEMREDGTLKSISEKWLDMDISETPVGENYQIMEEYTE